MKINFRVLTMMITTVVFAVSCGTNAENKRIRPLSHVGAPVDEGSVVVLFDEKGCPLQVVKLVDHCPVGQGDVHTICRWPETSANGPSRINWISMFPSGQRSEFQIVINSEQFPCSTELKSNLRNKRTKHHCIIKKDFLRSGVDYWKGKYSVITEKPSCPVNMRELDPYIVIIR